MAFEKAASNAGSVSTRPGEVHVDDANVYGRSRVANTDQSSVREPSRADCFGRYSSDGRDGSVSLPLVTGLDSPKSVDMLSVRAHVDDSGEHLFEPLASLTVRSGL